MEFRPLSVILLLITAGYAKAVESEKPTPVVILTPANQVFRGERVTLRCELQGGGGGEIEEPYIWNKNGNPVSPSSTKQQLIIQSVKYSDSGNYSCSGRVKGIRRDSNTSAAVTLTVFERSTPVVNITPANQVFRRETVTLRCELQGGGEIVGPYIWNKNGNPVSPSSPKQQLIIQSVEYSDRGEYSCRGTVKGIRRYSHTSAAVTLTVFERPTPVVIITPDNQVFRGERVTLRCDLQRERGQIISPYTWYKGNSVYPYSSSQEYTISSVTRSDSGDYSCRGTVKGTSRDSHTSTAVKLTVFERPKPVLNIKPGNRVFRGETVTIRCDLQGGGDFEWTYNWIQNSVSSFSTSNQYTISSVTDSHQGDYYCVGAVNETTHYSHYSDAVRLTVSETPKPELKSPLKGAALIGNPVTLYCNLKQSAGWRFYWFKHTQTPESETTTETHSSYTIRPVNVSDGGQYWCRAGRGDPVYYTHYSDALWVNVTASSSPVTLIVSPSRTQHFTTDSLSLICEEQSNSTGWRVRRYSLSESKVSDCSSGWASVTGSTCNISSLLTSHTGVYWCESESGGGSSAVNITVHDGSVILENPVHPVTEGDPLTLHCLYRNPKSSDLTADFYKDGLLLQNQTTGEMIIPTVSKSDEGLYHCKIPEKGESPQSWISVRGVSASGAPFSVLHLLIFLLAASPFLLSSIILGVKCYRARAKPGNVNRSEAVIEDCSSL